MEVGEIEALIAAGLPGASVRVEDLAGDGRHFAVHVAWAGFAGMSRVAQHQTVYAALKGAMDGADGAALHALQIHTSVPTE